MADVLFSLSLSRESSFPGKSTLLPGYFGLFTGHRLGFHLLILFIHKSLGVEEGESTTFFISEIYSDSELALIESQSIETFLID